MGGELLITVMFIILFFNKEITALLEAITGWYRRRK